VRATLKAEEDTATMHINEIEEYLGILQEHKCSLEMQVAEAEEQISMVWEILDSNGIPEVSLSDDESTPPPSSSPTSSGFAGLGILSSCPEGSSTAYPRRSGTPDSGSSSLSDYPRSGWVETAKV
jgi:hypothetical protein